MSAALGDVCSFWGPPDIDSDSQELLGIAANLAFRVVDNRSIDTSSRTGKFVMGSLALIAEFENDIRRERRFDGIAKAKKRGRPLRVQPKLTKQRSRRPGKLRPDLV